MEEPAPKPIGTINCLLCGGTQIYPGPRYQNHLIHEHGVVFDAEYLIKVSIHKRDKGQLPDIISADNVAKQSSENDAEEKIKPEMVTVEIQTDSSSVFGDSDRANEEESLCVKCKNPVDSLNLVEANGEHEYDEYDDDDDQYDEVMGRLVMDMEEEDEEIDLDADGQVKVWICPICPHVFKRHGHFKTHACTAHDISQVYRFF